MATLPSVNNVEDGEAPRDSGVVWEDGCPGIAEEVPAGWFQLPMQKHES